MRAVDPLRFRRARPSVRRRRLARAPALPPPDHRVIGAHRPLDARAWRICSPLPALPPPMSVAALRCPDREALFPEGPEGDFQETIAPSSVSIPARRLSFTSRSVQRTERRSTRPSACGGWAAIHSMSSSAEHGRTVAPGHRATARAAARDTRSHEQAVFYRCRAPEAAVTFRPALQRAQDFPVSVHLFHPNGPTRGWSRRHHRDVRSHAGPHYSSQRTASCPVSHQLPQEQERRGRRTCTRSSSGGRVCHSSAALVRLRIDFAAHHDPLARRCSAAT